MRIMGTFNSSTLCCIRIRILDGFVEHIRHLSFVLMSYNQTGVGASVVFVYFVSSRIPDQKKKKESERPKCFLFFIKRFVVISHGVSPLIVVITNESTLDHKNC